MIETSAPAASAAGTAGADLSETVSFSVIPNLMLFYFNQNIDAHYILAEEIRKKIVPVSWLFHHESTLGDFVDMLFY
ncbi:MAG: hypothetical protein LZF64_11215 [Nitrosomonas sp.]|nr:MAG: hypothetical protein LZF64_11215 [Nitrosomonas sp.]